MPTSSTKTNHWSLLLSNLPPSLQNPSSRTSQPHNRAPLALLKYFPKNIHSLPSDLYHRNLKARIKRLKQIKMIPSDHRNKILRVLMANKAKNVKLALSVRDTDCAKCNNKQNFQLLQMFPNVQKVEFCVLNQYVQDEQQQRSQANESAGPIKCQIISIA